MNANEYTNAVQEKMLAAIQRIELIARSAEDSEAVAALEAIRRQCDRVQEEIVALSTGVEA